MRIQERSMDFLREQVASLSKECGETLIPPSSDTQELFAMSDKELKDRFPSRYAMYVELLRSKKRDHSEDVGDVHNRITERLAMLNGLDRYIERHKSEEILREYQIDVFNDIRSYLEKGGRVGYVSLPTGFGKTVIFTQMIQAMDVPAVIVVPTTELVEQTLTRINQFTDSNDVGRVDKKAKDFLKKIIVTTYDSFVAQVDKGNINPEGVGLLILDEVHESLSTLRKDTVKKFDSSVIFGFTATPEYSDERSVAELLETEVHAISIPEAVEMGGLCEFSTMIASTDVDLSGVQVTADGTYDEAEVERAINIEQRNQGAVEVYKQFFPDEIALVNCSTVQHAKDVRSSFEAGGIRAAAIWGENNENGNSIAMAKNGDIQVLCGVRLLVRGIDIPRASVCINLHPTFSKVDAIQRGGRVLRLDPNNPEKHAKIVDFIDKDTRRSPLLFSQAIGGHLHVAPETRESVSSGGKQFPPADLESIHISGLQVIVDLTEQESFLRQLEYQENYIEETPEEVIDTRTVGQFLNLNHFGQVILNEGGQGLSLEKIQSELTSLGFMPPSRATIYRMKKGVPWNPEYHNAEGKIKRALPHGYVRLSAEERRLSVSVLCRRFGIADRTALAAKNRGWFEVQQSNSLTQMAKDRIRGKGKVLPPDLVP